jgi:hypothetical protein
VRIFSGLSQRSSVREPCWRMNRMVRIDATSEGARVSVERCPNRGYCATS